MSSSDGPDQTLADYVALALSPALIMGLVGSLVFFLLEVLYRGQYEGRLQWILFFFVFGAVLVARIAMTHAISGRAGVYGLVMGFLTWLGMQLFVDYDASVKPVAWLINAGLVGLVWWCARRLTWDCTNVDEETDMSGAGVLQAAGLEGDAKPEAEGEDVPLEVVEEKRQSWWQRYQRYRERQKKAKRTLGVWVIWFSLAALPLFGLGQSLVGPEEVGRRRYLFWLMTIYVGCGLGLLLTTCFLGLRRYLRQRRLRMPAAMTGAWLTVGGTLIVLLLLAGAFLPRPQAEYPVLGFMRLKSHERGASKFAMKNDAPGKGEGRPGENGPNDPKDNADSGGRGKGAKGKGQGKSGADGGKDGSGQGKRGSGSDKGNQGSSRQGDSKQGGDGAKSGNDNSRAGSKSGRDKANSGPKSERGGESKSGRGGGRKDGEQAKGDDQKSDGEQKSSGGSSSTSSRLTSGLASLTRTLGPVLKWVAFALLALAVLFVLLRSGLQFFANFTDWARRLLDTLNNFWANLFGGRRGAKKAEQEEAAAAAEAAERAVPFSAFANPFAGGRARMPADELVRYTLGALQAWARERGLGRQPGETALEFAARVGDELPALEADLRRLAALYARAVYARGGLPGNTVELVRQFWERLEAVAEQPMSA